MQELFSPIFVLIMAFSSKNFRFLSLKHTFHSYFRRMVPPILYKIRDMRPAYLTTSCASNFCQPGCPATCRGGKMGNKCWKNFFLGKKALSRRSAPWYTVHNAVELYIFSPNPFSCSHPLWGAGITGIAST